MKIVLHTTAERARIWHHLTSDLSRIGFVDLSMIDTATQQEISAPWSQQESPGSTTPAAKLGSNTLAPVQILDGPAADPDQLQRLHKELSNQSSTNADIVYILVLDISFEDVMSPSNKGAAPLQRVLHMIRNADGLILTLEATAEVLRRHWLGPISTLNGFEFDLLADMPPQPNHICAPGEAMAFTHALESILQSARVWKPVKTVCAQVATELKFLGIDHQSQAIDRVGANLKLLLPVFDL